MSSQIFKSKIPNAIFFDLLDNIALKSDKCYIFNNDSYKRGFLNDAIKIFIEKCKPHYYLSKCTYLERKLSYNTFTTIIRQICKFNKITYTSQIKYEKSTYNIIYYIFFNE